jgi:hypothetical protein
LDLTFALPTPRQVVANVKSTPLAGVAELVDALDLGVGAKSSTFRRRSAAVRQLFKSLQVHQWIGDPLRCR